jgi:hypothetical protein
MSKGGLVEANTLCKGARQLLEERDVARTRVKELEEALRFVADITDHVHPSAHRTAREALRDGD